MSQVHTLQDGTGVFLKNEKGDILQAYGTTVPADASSGYAPGCLFLDTDASAGSQWFINEGTLASSDFNAVSSINTAQTNTANNTWTGHNTFSGQAALIEADFDPSARVYARTDFGKKVYTKTVASDFVNYKSVASADLEWFMSGNGTLFGGTASSDGGTVISCSNTTKCAFIKPSTGSRYRKIKWSTSKTPRFRAVIKTGTVANSTICVGLYSGSGPDILTLGTPDAVRAEIILRNSVDSRWHCRTAGTTSGSGTASGAVANATVYDIEIRVDANRIATFYVNSTLVYTATVALTAGVNLLPIIGIASHHASNKKNMGVYHIMMSRAI